MTNDNLKLKILTYFECSKVKSGLQPKRTLGIIIVKRKS